MKEIEQLLLEINGISFTRSGLSFIEIRPAGSNKGAALASAAEVLGLQRENLLALGDNDNDMEMLLWAGVGVAIAGASNAALEASRFVSSSRCYDWRGRGAEIGEARATVLLPAGI